MSVGGVLISAGLIYYAEKVHRPAEPQVPIRRPPILVPGVDEPEEMKFEPVTVPTPTDEQKALA